MRRIRSDAREALVKKLIFGVQRNDPPTSGREIMFESESSDSTQLVAQTTCQ